MADILVGAIVGGAVVAFLFMVVLIGRAGSMGRAFQGLTIAGRSRHDPAFAAKLAALLAGGDVKPPSPPVPPAPPKPSGVPLRMLALLQAEARLVDFLMEDVQGFNDAQIGQAVREVHKKARATLTKHAVIEPVLPGTEGENTVVPVGFDPSAIRVIGNITGTPPFSGQINHVGWRVKELKLAALPEGADEFVLQPAEVQVP